MERHGYWDWLARLPERARAASEAGAASDGKGVSRRDFMSLLGASIALAGAGACTRATDKFIMPYTARPSTDPNGLPMAYATSMTLGGYAMGLLVECHAGRPTKIEGNPDHPASLGATGPIEQASVLQLYDPARARAPRHEALDATFDQIGSRLATERSDGGAGLRIVMEPTGSPLHAALLTRLLARAPQARVCFVAPLPDRALVAARLAYGQPLSTIYDLRRAQVIAAFDADFLTTGPFACRYAREYAEHRSHFDASTPPSRLYVVEAPLTPTGTMADHRLALPAAAIGRCIGGLAAEIVNGHDLRPVDMPAELVPALASLHARLGPERDLVAALARDLLRVPGESLVIVGEQQPPAAHVLGHLVNHALGNHGQTLSLHAPSLLASPAEEDLKTLADEIGAGTVDTLVVLDTNLAYAAPPDLRLSDLIANLAQSIYLGLYEDETAAVCKTFVPAAHYLEAWGDARAVDGTVSLVQPLIAPLYGGRTVAEMLAALAGEPGKSAHDLLVEAWQERYARPDFKAFFDAALSRGVVEGSANPAVSAPLVWPEVIRAAQELAHAPDQDAIEVSLRLDARVYDGRFSNNAWLLELPAPITKQSWGNAALLGSATAAAMGVEDGQQVEIETAAGAVLAPVLIMPGHAENSVTCHLGFGRSGAENLALGVGFNANLLRSSKKSELGALAVVRSTSTRESLAIVQPHRSLHDRPVALVATFANYRDLPALLARHTPPSASFYPENESHTQHPAVPPQGGVAEQDARRVAQWAMAIDLSRCTGCSACVVACQAENNIPVVGKAEVQKNRWMYWLRIDEYFTSVDGRDVTIRQPMLCQHCEKAPCEYVCPVNATVHSPDGLNEMVYNRCVGTRYCSNNCPYKVRRFNWFDWNDRLAVHERSLELQRNPDVTVRERGVMEKCTYCVQRIREAGIQATIHDRRLSAGDVRTACQQACPTGAITFGSLTHPESEVVKGHSDPRSYAALADQGTRPRTRYLVKLINPNPEVA